MHTEIAFVMLFAAATAVALLARRLRMPYTVALVLAGLILGSTHAFEAPRLTKDLLYAVFLPGLLFEAAFHLDFAKFWSNKLAIGALAVPGVVAAILLTGLLLTPLAGALALESNFRFIDGLVFGALIAATDPIAVVALFKSLGAPRRLGVLVEGESLLNDGTAVVLFTIILGLVAGSGVSWAAAGLEFIRVVGLGLGLGGLIGYAASRVIQRVDDPMIEITVTTVAAYGAFVFGEQLHVSGVIATVTAGMLCGNYGARTGMSASTRIAAETFWEYVAFALNSIVFLLIGFEVHIDALLSHALPIAVAYVTVVVIRGLIIGVTTALLKPTRERIPASWALVLGWGGLRGGLSMVLVLSLPDAFPHREFLVTVTFGVVLLSILLQGLSMAPLMRRLGLVGMREERVLYERRRGELLMARKALAELDQMQMSKAAPSSVLGQLQTEYEARVAEAEAGIQALHMEHTEIEAEEIHRARRHLLLAEKQRVLEAIHDGLLGQEAAEVLLADLDARLISLEEAHAGNHDQKT